MLSDHLNTLNLGGVPDLPGESESVHVAVGADPGEPGGNCIKIGLPGKLILSKGKGLREVLFY